MGKRKRRIEEKEEELLSEQLKKTKIEIYECWTHSNNADSSCYGSFDLVQVMF